MQVRLQLLCGQSSTETEHKRLTIQCFQRRPISRIQWIKSLMFIHLVPYKTCNQTVVHVFLNYWPIFIFYFHTWRTLCNYAIPECIEISKIRQSNWLTIPTPALRKKWWALVH